MSDDTETTGKKKGGMKKMLLMGVALVALVGGGVGAGLYAASSGLVGGGGGAAVANGPQLVPKAQEKRAAPAGGGDGEGHDESRASGAGESTPLGAGGDKYASTYYALEKEFTSNLQDSSHYIQVGLAVGTHYDDRVIQNLRTHEIAVRSAVLMTLGDATEEDVFTSDGKKRLQTRIVASINNVLKQKEGFGGIGNVYFTNFVVQ
ncbi:flagellar basal body-associated protein FliL [Hephaestia sp. GCM10023244]|uniref:flagellar basal body-associated FliL family protein n=1 Tax=unclassified Hephaestia TaxID=2631281 RepID=UPI00207749CD|nr:flagellar basal body-associated FliL family protein [Hephaestia sp. MAHUQ-44]MCM8731266.1 flagellar basal body-associated FliL family protein [Hephaestia sp. MAHUQ-44]